MRTRLVASYLLLMCLVLLALEIPLGLVLVSRDTEQVATDRLADATRFASLAGPALDAGELDVISTEFRRYHQLYGIGAAVLDLEQRVVAQSGLGNLDRRAVDAVRQALTGRQVSSYQTVWPWRAPPLVTAAPVTNGGEVLGAVVTVSPTGKLQDRVRGIWLPLAGGGLLALLACVGTAFAMARWAIKPVTDLAATAGQITAGEHTARVPHPSGPSELRKLAVSFNEMADSVTEALERQRSFVAHASHQLRNPLTALRLRVEELGHELTSEAARSEQEMALAETDALGHLLDGLLALARAERGQHALTTVDAIEVTEARVRAWQPLADRRGVALKLLAPAGPLLVSAVATALDQALDALIDNALKFTADRVTVEVIAQDEGVAAGAGVAAKAGVAAGAGMAAKAGVAAGAGVAAKAGVAVHVTDNGRGMTEEQRRRAIEPFWRAPDAQNIDGAGLGLAIAHVLIEVSGGRIGLLSAYPQGLDAKVWLPSHSLLSR